MQVTVVGNYPKIPNLPRPARLRNAYARLDRGELSPEEVAQVEDEVTIEVMKEQERAGIELLTDGQIRWMDEQTYIAGKLGGIELTGLIRFFDTNTYYRQPLIQGDVVRGDPIFLDDYQFAVDNASRPVKPVLTGPYTLARLSRDEHYDSVEKLAGAFAEALNAEARSLLGSNPPLIQFNEPAITRHPEEVPLAEAVWKTLLDRIDAETAVYFYFGPPGPAYAAAVRAGFTTVGVDATIEGALDAIKGEPKPQKLAAGVMDSRTTRLESVDQLASLVREAAALTGSDNLYVNPNMGLEFLPREQAQAKLVRLVEGVNRARGGAA
ncbi:MAG TPA: methylcobamide--CoM methyltransferase [Dehalococcoidia bacterium]|jgi:5-methyltetrahydropteroyltriglutamate--homocysteine methyltransferase|nr:methylcobamide--CoM methyltransferase [Dehalococcoidia bacterium]